MATNVTEKDKTLNEIIDWAKSRCHEAALSRFDVRRKSDRDFYDGQVNAFHEILELCCSMLGHYKRRLNEMGYFQIPVSWYRDETMLELMRKSPASIGLYVMMISWCSDNRSYGDIPYTVIRYVLDGEDDELQAIIDAGFLTKTDKVRLREPVYHIKSFRRFDPRSREPISKKLRKAVYERDHYRCVECGATDHLSLDHIIPWSLGGEDTMENLQTMCRSCNSRKGNRLDVVQGG